MKKGMLIVSILIILTLLVGCDRFAIGKGVAEPIENVTISAKIDADGVAYIPLMDGSAIKIDDDVKAAALTSDRATVIVLQNDGTVYYTDAGLTEKHVLSAKGESYSSVCDAGFILTSPEGDRYRVRFSDGNEYKIGPFGFAKASKSLTLVFADNQGVVYLLNESSEEKERIGRYDSHCTLNAVTNDGSIAIWTSRDDKGHREIYLHENDDTSKIGEYDSSSEYFSTSVQFSMDETFALISSSYSDKLWIKTANNEVITVKLGSNYVSAACAPGPISKLDASRISELYVTTKASTGNNLYVITLDGEKEKILSKISSAIIRGKNVFYTNTDNDLYLGSISGSTVSEETRLASSVNEFSCSFDGQYLYYIKDADNNLGNLYVLKVGEKEPKKIATDIPGLLGSIFYFYPSNDGRSVLYYKDLEDIPDTISSCGTLYLWNYSSGESLKLSHDVMMYSLVDGTNSFGYDTNALMYSRYDSVDAEKKILVNWMFFNGKDSVKIASEVRD